MKIKHKSVYLLIGFLTTLRIGQLQAQTNASPYSMIGLGTLNYNNYDRATGMANAGMSLSSPTYMYLANPASFADMQNTVFKAELSANYKGVYYTGGNNLSPTDNIHSNDVQFQKILFGLKVKNWWGTAFGLKQFSSINYAYAGTENINGAVTTVPVTITGTGGLNQFFWINSFRLAKGLNIGMESSFLFGSQQQQKTTSPDGVAITSPLNTTLTTYYHKIYFKGGLQYHTRLSDKAILGVGLTASNKTQLHGAMTYDLTEGDLATTTVPTTIVKDSSVGYSQFTLPLTVGGGISLLYDNKWTFATDYQRQQWQNAGNAKGLGYTYGNAQRFSAGVEYAKKQTFIQNGYVREMERYYLQFGGYYNQGFLNIRGKRIDDIGGTVGVGFNSKRTALGYMLNLSVGSLGTTSNSLMRETYYQVGVTLTYSDLWNTTKKVID